MRNLLLFGLILCILTPVFSQGTIPLLPPHLLKVIKTGEFNPVRDEVGNPNTDLIITKSFSDVLPNEQVIGTTIYDYWSNSLVGNRFHHYDDGAMAGVWSMGFEPTTFPDRGTGYIYYNGTEWLPEPASRIENLRCGWPSYAPWMDGEIIISHNGTEGLEIMTREERGTGEWTQENYLGPAGIENEPSWPRVITTGENNEIIHMVYNSWVEYMGQDKALLYSRSNDGGVTWDPQNVILEGTGEDYYTGFGGDDYMFAARGNTLVLFMGSAWTDMLFLKSTDNGDTWEKTVVWEHPYQFYDWDVTITDTFFCCDNAAHCAIDPDGMVHVVFGISRVLHAEVGNNYNYFYLYDGIGYWNEDMEPFGDHIHALSGPQYGFANSEMLENYNYIGWMQDVNADGEVTLADEVRSYDQLGPSTMPTITIDDQGRRFVLYASLTETYEVDLYNYKHIWGRAYENGEWGPFVDLSGDIVHIFDECIHPHLAPTSDGSLHYIYMADATPGMAQNDDHAWQENRIIYAMLDKNELLTSVKELTEENKNLTVGQSYPNPMRSSAKINVSLEEGSELSLVITNLTGQKVQEYHHGYLNAGTHSLDIERSTMKSGIYFYTVQAGLLSVSNKVLVD